MSQTFLQEKFIGREGQVLKFNDQGILEAVDISIQSIKPQIVVYTETGSAVTCSRQGVVLTAEENNGKWVFNLPNIGNWECVAINSLGDMGSNTVEVTEVKQYTIEIQIAEHIDTSLENNSWETIGALSSASLASNYWNIGDTKLITLNGTPTNASYVNFNNYKVYATIIGFDHNSDLEGIGLTHFQIGNFYISDNPNNTDIRVAFTDQYYTSSSITSYSFRMDTSSNSTSPVAWSTSKMRVDICSKFKNCLPEDLKAVLGTAYKYTDNSKSNDSSTYNYTPTKDSIFLLSKYEIGGGNSYYEEDWQEKYEYYNVSSNTQRRRVSFSGSSSSLGDTCYWWLRTPGKSTSSVSNTSYYTFYISTATTNSASTSKRSSCLSCGFSPAFVVGKVN